MGTIGMFLVALAITAGLMWLTLLIPGKIRTVFYLSLLCAPGYYGYVEFPRRVEIASERPATDQCYIVESTLWHAYKGWYSEKGLAAKTPEERENIALSTPRIINEHIDDAVFLDILKRVQEDKVAMHLAPSSTKNFEAYLSNVRDAQHEKCLLNTGIDNLYILRN